MNDKQKQLLAEYSVKPNVERVYTAISSLAKKRLVAIKIRKNLENLKSKTTARYKLIKDCGEIADHDYNEQRTLLRAFIDYDEKAYNRVFDWLYQNPDYTPYLSIIGKYRTPQEISPISCGKIVLSPDQAAVLTKYMAKPSIEILCIQLSSLEGSEDMSRRVAKNLRNEKSTTTKRYKSLQEWSEMHDADYIQMLSFIGLMRDFNLDVYDIITGWLIKNPNYTWADAMCGTRPPPVINL